jgi:hypothetical protein
MKNDSDRMTEQMSKAGTGQPVLERGGNRAPKKGDRFHCDGCGMEVTVTAGCSCPENNTSFECCGREMRKV